MTLTYDAGNFQLPVLLFPKTNKLECPTIRLAIFGMTQCMTLLPELHHNLLWDKFRDSIPQVFFLNPCSVEQVFGKLAYFFRSFLIYRYRE